VADTFIRPRVDQSTARHALLTLIAANVAFFAAHPRHALAVMNIIRAGLTDSGALRFDAAVFEPRRAAYREILEWGQRTEEFRPFDIRVMVATIVEALDAVPQQLADEPDLDLEAYGHSLVELFDRATRCDADEEAP
jgi:hypothetical protein